jgi:hypothetical protein
VRVLAGIVISALVGLALSVAATVAIVQTNSPDKSVESSFESGNFKEPRQVVQYGQR